MKSLMEKKELLIIGVAIILVLSTSMFSLFSIKTLHGNARVVNFVGIVRGATQKLVKEELMGYKDDQLIERLSNIVTELLNGKGENNLVVLHDEKYLENMSEVEEKWTSLKQEIYAVRSGADKQKLFDDSQEYFDLVNRTVFSAEAYSEAQVTQMKKLLFAINIIFIFLLFFAMFFTLRGIALRRRADSLGKIAYVDSLTGMDNRASCERLICRLKETPPCESIVVCMFDMNDLKLTNDFLGHKGGDKVIKEFAKIIKRNAAPYGFIGRFGGDEFLAIFENCNDGIAIDYLSNVRKDVNDYNSQMTNNLEKINYAAGYVIDVLSNTCIDDLVHNADNKMYEDKRRTKIV